MKMFLRTSCLCCVALFSLIAKAIQPEPASTVTKKPLTPLGPFTLVEWNPVDLAFSRIHLDGEYIVVDGFAFGAEAEYQKQTDKAYRQSTIVAGVTATQYFRSQTMQGIYLKGGVDVFRSGYQIAGDSSDKSLVGANLGLDLGYRLNFARYVTGAVSYGVRRNLPDFFSLDGNRAHPEVDAFIKPWDLRLNLSLGLAL